MASSHDFRIKIKASLFSLFTALVLFIAKLVFGLRSDSVSVLASALDSLMDFGASMIILVGIVSASKPADHDHRFGHGKSEALASFLQSLFVFASGLFLAYKSIHRFLVPEKLKSIEEAMWVMGLSIGLTLILVLYQQYAIRKTGSIAVESDRMHYLTDLLTNSAVILALLLDKFLAWSMADSIIGFILSLYVIYASLVLVKRSTDILMDKDISDKYRDTLGRIVEKYDEIYGFHDLRSRSSGDLNFLEFHLEMPQEITLQTSHELVEKVMHDINREHPKTEIMIHTDPVYLDPSGKKKLLDKAKPRFY